jgi:hypothetical protein
MFTLCPKCGHKPLPENQAFPAACPSCGVILDKVTKSLDERGIADLVKMRHKSQRIKATYANPRKLTKPRAILFNESADVDSAVFWCCVVLWFLFAIWGMNLLVQDYRTGQIGASFIHRPLLIFHEAGHVISRLFGNWMMVLGGTLGQLIMPAILGSALLFKNRDPFGASIGLWLFGVSLLDVAPYMYDALHPQLMLLSGMTGEEGGHDWIYLFSSLGLLEKAQVVGAVVHKLGALTVIVAIAWGGWVLRLQHTRLCAGT